MYYSSDLWDKLNSADTEEARQYILAQIDQRGKQGVCDADARCLCDFICTLMPIALEKMSDATDVHPENFADLDTWKAYLKTLAAQFRRAMEAECDWRAEESSMLIRQAMQELGEHFWNLWIDGDSVN